MDSSDEEHDQPCSIIADVFQGVPETINTVHGPIHFTVYGDRSKSPCIAYSEVGLNHRTCFQSLFVASGPQSLILKNFFTVFIDPPGCHPGNTGSKERVEPTKNPKDHLERMMLDIDQVIDHLGVKECLGLGVGTGAYLLARYAAEHGGKKCPFIGLILISPSSRKSSWWEWTTGSLAAYRLEKFGWSRGTKQHFCHRLFSPATTQYLGGDSDLMKAFRRNIQELNHVAVSNYLKAALSRDDIRPILKDIPCRILLVFGDQSIYQGESMELATHVDKTKFALVEVRHAGTLVNEEHPAELLSPLQLFLTALQLEGYGLGSSTMVGQ
jgi:pimeloyl-ACP methyl ester carboxylesterase